MIRYISAVAEKLVKNYLTMISFKNLFKKVLIKYNLLFVNATLGNKNKQQTNRATFK